MHHQKDKEDLEEISNELELADEEEKVPYVQTRDLAACSTLTGLLF